MHFYIDIGRNTYAFLAFQPFPLHPHHWRFLRQLKQHRVLRHRLVRNRRNCPWRYHGQVDHSADVAVVHALSGCQLVHGFHLAGLQRG